MVDGENELIGGFRVVTKLRAGSGAQGTVYKAVCENDDYPKCPRGTVVALKTMTVLGDDNEAAYRRLARQTKTLCGIEHPNLVRYYGCFSEQTAFAEYYAVVEELLEGETLKACLERHPNGLDADEAVRVTKAMVAGLRAAESAGVIHRDVKPANVFLCSDGGVKIIDFEVSEGTEGTVNTVSGNMIGTFEYMAPDFTDPHFSGDEASDVFSAGVVMHEIFSGRLPYPRFPGDARQASFAFLERWARDERGDFARDALVVSPRVERFVAHAKVVLQRALTPQRARRFATFAELDEALAGIRFRDLKNGEACYRMLQLVGKGGFGEVFKARSGVRTVAVKHLLKPEYASRFYREAKIMSELDDPCFVRFFDFFVLDHGGRREAFLVMDFLPGMPGSSLRDAIRRSAGSGLPFDAVLRAFIRYAHGLKVIHDKGVFHRDIKPTNLYYPEERPGDATIMDLGIARETDGTETTGLVPGTLDYMPPETVTQGMRGDAGMDIYALGLCLYEALTGKKGFPRLPNGSAAYAQFFKRAREKARPALEDPRVLAVPALHDLLMRMTAPEPKERLNDAGRLEEELSAIRDGKTALSEAADESETLTQTSTRTLDTSAADDGLTQGDDGDTCETAFVAPASVAREAQAEIRAQMRKLDRERGVSHPPVWPKIAAIVLLAAGAGALWFFRAPLWGFLLRFDVVRKVVPRAETPLATVGTQSAVETGVPDLYGDDTVPLAQADKLRDRWLEARRPPAHSAAEYERLAGILDSYREQRVIRDRMARERSRIDREMKDVAKAYRDEGVDAGDRRRETWLGVWKAAPKAKLSEAVRLFAEARAARQKADAAHALVREAEEAARRVAQSYGTNGEKIADREFAVWKNNWKDRLLTEDYLRIQRPIEEARARLLKRLGQERRLREAKTLEAECRALCAMLQPVASRTSRLAEAETRAAEGVRLGVLSAETGRELQAEIARCRTWVVFEIQNNSDHELTVDGRRLANGNSALFVYTNRPPENLSAECPGYEPVVLGRQSSGKRLRLLPEHFNLLKVPVKTGSFEAGVFCQVDGVSVQPGVIKLLPGVHECVYIRQDYNRQTMPFKVDIGVPTQLPTPGEWTHTEDWQQRARQRAQAEKSARAEAEIAKLLADEPVATRPDRLVVCTRRIDVGLKSELLSPARAKALRADLEKALARGLGAVDNRTTKMLSVEVGGATVEIPPRTRRLVAFPLEGARALSLCARGYEPILTPDDFNGAEFAVDEDMLRQSPVRATLPVLEEGVSCWIDGAETGSEPVLTPGRHAVVFRRPDYEDVRFDIVVKPGEPLTLPRPVDWVEKPALVKLIAAEAAADSGDWARAREVLAEARQAGVASARRVEKLFKRIACYESFCVRRDAASAAYREERWGECVRGFASLCRDGCVLTEAERRQAAEASEKALGEAEFEKRLSERPGSQIDPARATKNLKALHEDVDLLRADALKHASEKAD